MSNHAASSMEYRFPQANLLEQILAPANIQRAWERVKANKGAAGIDGMSIEQFPAFAETHLSRILTLIRQGRYKPAAVRRVKRSTGSKNAFAKSPSAAKASP